MSERLDTARRLELSGVAEVGGHVEGTFRGVKVTMEDHGLERTLKFELGRAVRWVSILPRTAEVNDPDVVQTGDSDFDLAVTVLAQDGHEPAMRAVFDTTALRAGVLAFFQRFPNASLRGATLTLPNVAAENHETSAALDQGSKLVLALRAALDLSPNLPPEAAPVLSNVMPTAEQIEAPDPDDLKLVGPTPRDQRRAYALLSAIATVSLMATFHSQWTVVALIGTVITSGILLWADWK